MINKKFFLISFILVFVLTSFSLAQKTKFKPNRYLETIINEGPSLVVEDNNVKFKFTGINLRKPDERIYFQIKLWPLDKDWQNYYYSEKSYYNLPRGRNFYFFYVRAINDKNEYDPKPAIYFFETRISPYYKDVSLGTFYDGLRLTLYNNTNKEINITGWKIHTSRIVFTIPQGVRDFVYDVKKAKFEDIILAPYGKAIIYAVYSSATSAPLGSDWRNLPLSPYGFNFLNNKCFFYIDSNLSDYYCDSLTFNREELLNMVLSGKISSNCAVLLSSADCDGSWLLRRLRESKDSRCQAIVEDWYNYQSCYRRRSNEKDFFGKTWRIYFDPRSDYDKENRKLLERFYRDRYERISLYDQNNLLVNTYEIY